MAKKAAKKQGAKPAPKKAAPPKSAKEVKVRMFCQGLGDCFLISIPNGMGAPYHVLIDFGVAKGTPNDSAKMTDAASQIAKLTKGKVDLLVITHEHWDHVSGFLLADQKVLDSITFKHLWVAWTEDPRDKLAIELKQAYGKAKIALARTFTQVKTRADLAGKNSAINGIMNGLNGLAGFLGPGDLDSAVVSYEFNQTASRGILGTAPAEKPTGKQTIQDAMNAAKARIEKKENIFCLRPGEVPPLPGAKQGGMAAKLKVRVLGPPHDGPQVRKLDSSKETYHKQNHLHFGGVPWTWLATLDAMSQPGSPFGAAAVPTTGMQVEIEKELGMPFDKKFRIAWAAAPKVQSRSETGTSYFFVDRYGFVAPAAPGTTSPQAQAQAQAANLRRIDGDWLSRGSQQLALWINRYTNNISLVLAFELPSSKKNLLFVGDAQVGNWLSWHDVKMSDSPATPNGPEKEITMTDLFARTVLYKVGHHGSHNATLKAKGLELMTHPELVAMLPVDHEQAQQLGYGEMPLGEILTELEKRCNGRVLRLDAPWKKPHTGDWHGLSAPSIELPADNKASGSMTCTVIDR